MFLYYTVIYDEEYLSCFKKKVINSLKIVNDIAEGAAVLMERYNATLTLNESQKKCLLKCVQEHQKMNPDCKQNTLQRQYLPSILYSNIFVFFFMTNLNT